MKKKPLSNITRQRVFSAYHDVFVENVQVRTKKDIRNLVLQHWPSKKSLVGGCGIQKAVTAMQTLLNEGIFEPEARAGKEQDQDTLPSMHSTIPLDGT